ncbi:anti-sigma factor RsbA family regulatory protein [Kribbella sancticallisti]|uniref:Anti-sigma factor RsbA family regulatory protein n=1 Tax=Kribbella sancticallisti TaxID=460087 RepID=A0ABP4Q3S1_9ACTN
MLIDSAADAVDGLPTGFQHDAFVYIDDEEFVRHTGPFVGDGLKAGEVVLAALPESRIALLREDLGSAADQVTFVDITEAGRNPARIIPLWADFLARNPGRAARGLGEPAFQGRNPAEFEEAKLHEALLNVAFEHSGPFKLRCPYSASVLSPGLDPTETHPLVIESAAGPPSTGWAEVAQKTFATRLPAVPKCAEQQEFVLAELPAVRRWAADWARAKGMSRDQVDDLALALHEICTNSIRFGGGRGTLSLWTADCTLICDIADRGLIDDLLVGRVLPPIDGLGGRGVWLANQLCDLVQIRSGADGTQVRLHCRLG